MKHLTLATVLALSVSGCAGSLKGLDPFEVLHVATEAVGVVCDIVKGKPTAAEHCDHTRAGLERLQTFEELMPPPEEFQK